MVLYSVELRELEAKLKAGYMNKERAAQLAEKEVIKKKEEVMKYCKLWGKNISTWVTKGLE